MYLLSDASRLALEHRPSTQWLPGVLSPGVNPWGMKLAIHLYVEVRNEWSDTFTLSHVFMACATKKLPFT
jgi:hypothetical protein